MSFSASFSQQPFEISFFAYSFFFIVEFLVNFRPAAVISIPPR